MKNKSLFTIVFFLLCFSLKADNKNYQSYPQDNFFDDTLLIIHYNHPYYESIDFIKNLYGKAFKNIVFYGELPHKDVIAVTTTIGFYLSRVVADALTRFPSYNGYIFLQDDVLMNYWNFTSLDKEKIWFAISRYPRQDMQQPISWETTFDKSKSKYEFLHATIDGSYNDGWYWWTHETGIEPMQKVIKFFKKKDIKMLKQNIGRNQLVAQVCDMFYLPKKYSVDAKRISRLFRDVFCEISIPMMLNSLDRIENWEILKMFWGYSDPGQYRTDLDWFHPLKFSFPENRNLAEQAINNFYNTQQ